LLFVVAILGGAIAALSGFGIGSVLALLLALSVETKEAVVAVSGIDPCTLCARLLC
jgi:urea transporter